MTVTILAASNMLDACNLTRELVIKNPIEPDASLDYEAVQGWPLITALYNGIEQALKMMLLVPEDTSFTPEALKREYGHNLEKLYAELRADDRDHIELHFQEHRSLHNYEPPSIGIATAEQFIAHMNNGGNQSGLLSWRYILIEDISGIPWTSLWTMSEVWDALCCRIRSDVLNKHDDCSRLSHRLFEDYHEQLPIGIPYDMFKSDFNRWLIHKDGDPLAAWIDLLGKVHRDAISEVQAPERLRLELDNVARKILTLPTSDTASPSDERDATNPDDERLLQRIQDEPSLRWDPYGGIFR